MTRLAVRNYTSCLQFGPGVNNNVAVPNTADLHFGAGSMWVAGWFDFSNINTGAASNIIFQSDRTNYVNGLVLNQFASNLFIYVQSAGTTYAATNFFVGLKKGWHRLFVTVDASDSKVRIYLDGALWGTSGAITAWNITSTNTACIGAALDLTTSCQMSINDIQVGKGTAPTLAQVQADYYNGQTAPGLVRRYMVNEGSGTNIIDSVAGQNGTKGTDPFWKINTVMKARSAVAQKQNFLKYSSDVSISTAGNWDTNHNAIVTANQTVNPLTGATTAALMSDDNANTYHEIAQSSTGTAVAGTVYTFSVLVKRNTIQWINLGLQTPGINAYFDIQNGVTGNTTGTGFLGSKITAYPGWAGWYWCEITFLPSAMAQCQIYTASANGTVIYQGSSALSFYIAHAQLVAANWRGPTTLTTTTAVNTGNIRNIAPTAQNLLTYSNDFTQTPWTKLNSTVTANQAANPVTGANDAFKFTDSNDAGLAVHAVYRSAGVTGTALARGYTISGYFKAGTNTWVALFNDGSVSARGAYFDLTNGVLGTIYGSGSTASIQSLGGGWYRCSYYDPRTTSLCVAGAWIVKANATDQYQGNGTGTMYAYGLQLVEAQWAGPYVETTTMPTGVLPIRNVVPQSQNLLKYSEDITQGAAWTLSNLTTPTFTTDSRGGNTAQYVLDNAVNGIHQFWDSYSNLAGLIYTRSMEVKAVGANWLLFGENNAADYVYYDPTNGVFGTVSGTNIIDKTAKSLGNGWYRVSLTFRGTASTNSRIMIATGGDASATSYAGDGTKGFIVARQQLVLANWPGAYTQTTVAAINNGNIRNLA